MSKELSQTSDTTQASGRIPYSTPSVTNYGAVRDLTASGSKDGKENHGNTAGNKP